MSVSAGSTGTAHQFPPHDTRAWLAWIARHMRREQQTVFLIENLQPSWLASRSQRVAYVLLDSVALGALTGLIFYIAWSVSVRLDPPAVAQRWIPLWLWVAMTTVWAMFLGVIDSARVPWRGARAGRGKAATIASRVFRAFVMVLLWTALWALLGVALGDGWAAITECDPGVTSCSEAGATLDLSRPLLCAAYLAVIYGVKVRGDTTVKPVEALGWSWESAGLGLVLGALAGVIVWVVYFAVHWGEPTPALLRNLWLYPPLGGAGGLVIGGLSVRVVREKSVPNQGIRLSFRNALLGAAVFGPTLGLVAWPVLLVTLASPTRPTPSDVIPFGAFLLGIVAMLVGFAWFGGREVIMHGSLRLVLAATRQMPRDLVRFLDHCVELDLLRRVGGGYVFIHRYLLEYFGALEPGGPREGR